MAQLIPINKCKKVGELLGSEERWARGALAKDKRGNELKDEFSPEAARFCLVGAVLRMYPERKEARMILQRIREATGVKWIDDYNDSCTYEEVRGLIARLGI